MLFPSYNVTFKRGSEEWIVVTGEIQNIAKRNFTTAVFRLVLFDKRRVMGIGFIKLRSFRARSIRRFEVLIHGLHYKLIPTIVNYRIILESGY